MSKNLSMGLLGLGVVVLLFGLFAHLALHGTIFPHFSLVVGAVAVILLAAGAYGFLGQSQQGTSK